jgi:hypothetical protein
MGICRDCQAEIEYDGERWVETPTDGESGSTPDQCPASMSANHHPEA